jgi:hypothetical protein
VFIIGNSCAARQKIAAAQRKLAETFAVMTIAMNFYFDN